MSKHTAAPEHLETEGKALWSQIVTKYDLRDDELRTLEDACSATDMLADLQRAWREMGRPYMSKGSMGQEVEHPLIGSIDKQRKARQQFLRQLALPDADGDAGSDEGRSTQARAAANARWSRRGA